MYALTWCNHNHIIFVLVSFLGKGDRQSWFDGHLGKDPTWGSGNDTQTFCDLAHEFHSFIVMWCDFALLHHKGSRGIEKNNKFLRCLVYLFLVNFLLLNLKNFVHF